MNGTYRVFASSLVVAAAACTPLRAQSPSSCLGDHAYIANQRTELTRVVTGSDTTSARGRAALSLLPASGSEVALVVDQAVCAQAAQALVAAIGREGDPVRPVWVLKLGTDRYFVADGVRMSSGRYVAVIFDSNFAMKRALLTS
jgi:hypothetical protein